MRAVGRLLPPSYVFENMRSVVAGHGYSGRALLTGIALALLDILLAAWLFTAHLPLRGTQRTAGALQRRERRLGKAAP